MDAFFLFIRPYLIGGVLGLSVATLIVSFASRPNYEAYEHDFYTTTSAPDKEGAFVNLVDQHNQWLADETEAFWRQTWKEQQEWDAKLIQGMRERGIKNPEETLYRTRNWTP